MSRILTIALACFLCSNFAAFAQQKLVVAFYNQENLFDTIDDPHKNDNEFLPSGKNEWNTEKYGNKLNNMSKVIASMNEGNGPDILGLCEVENALVLSDLTKQTGLVKMKYGFAHFESPDERSIDNALIYQTKKLTLIQTYPYPVIFTENLNSKTRDILLVKLQERKSKQNIIVLVNHFPSRLGGQLESAPKRNNAAKILRGIYDSIAKADPKTVVVMMGDFNDEPTDESMNKVLGAKGNQAELNTGDIFNAMYSLKEQKQGSHFYRGEWSALDQILMSSNMVNCTGKICYRPSSVSIYKQDWMLETSEKFKGAPLRTFAGKKYLNGYSDHLPVFVILEVRK